MRASFPSPRSSRALLAAGALLVLAAVPIGALMLARYAPAVSWLVPFLAACVGGIVAVRARPDSLAAGRLLLFGVVALAWNLAGYALVLAFESAGPRWWLGPANVTVGTLGLLMAASLVGLLAVYPDGAHHRRYEGPLVRGAAALAVAVPALLLLASPTLVPASVFGWVAEAPGAGFPSLPRLESPVHLPALAFLDAPLRGYHEAALGLEFLAGAVVALLRYRHLPAEQRLRVRWPLVGALALLILPVGELLSALGALPVAVSDVLEILLLLALPAFTAVGLVRPDLFDLGRAVRRSLVYVPLWIAIAAAYAGIATALGLAASGAGLQVALGVTIAATVLFEPARRSLARRAARWAYGETPSGEELLRRLGATLEHTLDSDALAAGIASTAREGLGVAWTRIALDGGAPVVDGDRPAGPALPVATARLVRAGEDLGVIECGPPVSGGVRAPDRDLLETLAGQAALAIHNARLASELGLRLDEVREQAAELAASRSRIVTAEDAARRRIGRDIHDGAQQELVALIARLALGRNQLGRDPSRLDETFGDLEAEARQALENLRQFASGIHPPVLSDRGLVEAIESRAARLPVGVTIECEPGMRDARFGEAAEGAAYFVVSEGITNALKHSGAERVCVRLALSAGAIEVQVADDGGGFDPAAAGGSGLAGLADRISALGGTLAVDARPGGGTRLSARLPVEAPAALPG